MIGPLPDNASLAQARDWLRERVEDGAQCPCCEQRAQVYRRKFNSAMAYGLIVFYRMHGMDEGHAPTTEHLARLGGELARLSLWGMLEERQERRDDGGRAGWWRITETGRNFVQHRSKVPSHARVYDGRVLNFDTTRSVSITDALGAKFNYAELMSGVAQ